MNWARNVIDGIAAGHVQYTKHEYQRPILRLRALQDACMHRGIYSPKLFEHIPQRVHSEDVRAGREKELDDANATHGAGPMKRGVSVIVDGYVRVYVGRRIDEDVRKG